MPCPPTVSLKLLSRSCIFKVKIRQPPDVLLYVGTQNSSKFSILGHFGPKFTFFDLWPWKWRSRSYIFNVKISKASSEWKTENFELSHVQIGRLVWAVGRSNKKTKNYVSPVSMLNHTSSLLYSATAEYWSGTPSRINKIHTFSYPFLVPMERVWKNLKMSYSMIDNSVVWKDR
jgi:hypothetical protein